MYAYTHAYIIFMHACLYVFRPMFAKYVHMYERMCANVYAYMYLYIYSCMHACMYVYLCVNVGPCIYASLYTYVGLFMCVHV